QGKFVVRLKGGDPFVFGRGGEEALALAAEGIPCEVIPGISSAIAVPASAGIPVTQRGLASSVTIVTGHEQYGGDGQAVDWEQLAKLGGTLVILMGVESLPRICQRLLAGGLAPATPAAVVQQGTLPDQRVVTAPLARLVDSVREAAIKAPAVIIIGAVAALADILNPLLSGMTHSR
ncbi:MAG TPA: uroporphyrinogen-III C-methyltransferase, partial [Ktedonobacteraceae bacterium]|nr:uroporphyrinogen-III C-methyltransferase [Ktedonobacteraceae bacterium]